MKARAIALYQSGLSTREAAKEIGVHRGDVFDWVSQAGISRSHKRRVAGRVDDFLTRVEFDLNGGCWLWAGTLTSNGYGKTALDGQPCRAHRASWMQYRGEVPVGLFVLHRCDVRACVNPDHLFLGTHRDNMADKAAKNRGGNPTAKLNAETAEQLRRDRTSGLSYQQLAKRYGVSWGSARAVALGVAWKSKNPPSPEARGEVVTSEG